MKKNFLTLSAAVVSLILAVVTLSGCSLFDTVSKKTIEQYLEKAVPEAMALFPLPEGYTEKEVPFTELYSSEITDAVKNGEMDPQLKKLFESADLTEEKLLESISEVDIGNYLCYYDENDRLLYSAGPLFCLLPNVLLLAIKPAAYGFGVTSYNPETGNVSGTYSFEIDLKNGGLWNISSSKEILPDGYVEKKYDPLGNPCHIREVQNNEAGLPVKITTTGSETLLNLISGISISDIVTEETFEYDDQMRLVRSEEVTVATPGNSSHFIEVNGESVIAKTLSQSGGRIVKEYKYGDGPEKTELCITQICGDGFISEINTFKYDKDGNIIEETKFTHEKNLNENGFGTDVTTQYLTKSDKTIVTGKTTVDIWESATYTTVESFDSEGNPTYIEKSMDSDELTLKMEFIHHSEDNPLQDGEQDYYHPAGLDNGYSFNPLYIPENEWKPVYWFLESRDSSGNRKMFYEKYSGHPTHQDIIQQETYKNGELIFEMTDSLTGGNSFEKRSFDDGVFEKTWSSEAYPPDVETPEYYVFTAVEKYKVSSLEGERFTGDVVYVDQTHYKNLGDRELGIIFPKMNVETHEYDSRGRLVYHSIFDAEMSDDMQMYRQNVSYDYHVSSFNEKGEKDLYSLEKSLEDYIYIESVSIDTNGNRVFLAQECGVGLNYDDPKQRLRPDDSVLNRYDLTKTFSERRTVYNSDGVLISDSYRMFIPEDIHFPALYCEEIYQFGKNYRGGILSSCYEFLFATGEEIIVHYEEKNGDMKLSSETYYLNDVVVKDINYYDDYFTEKVFDENGDFVESHSYSQDLLISYENQEYYEDYDYYPENTIFRIYKSIKNSPDYLCSFYDRQGNLIAIDDGSFLTLYDENGIEKGKYTYLYYRNYYEIGMYSYVIKNGDDHTSEEHIDFPTLNS